MIQLIEERINYDIVNMLQYALMHILVSAFLYIVYIN